MTEKEALEAVRKAIVPETLSYVQEIVFTQSWEGQLYPEIAKSVGYHPEYIRDVGAQLWRSLSDAVGQKVTKKNVRFVLNSLVEQSLLPEAKAVGNSPSAVSDASAGDRLQTVQKDVQWRSHPAATDVPIGEGLSTASTATQLAFPSVGLPLKSAFYVSRPPAEEQAFAEIERPGGLLRIKSPGNTGKTSLVLRTLATARSQGARTVLINLQEADTAILEDLGRFLRWFCRNAAQQLGVENKLDDYWDDEIGQKISCKIYFREYLLNRINAPIVLALDEVDQLFDHPALVQEFLPMLRVWHEESMELEVWQKLRLILAYNTEMYVPLKISQSPFNIGLSVQLPALSLAQTQQLAEQYELLNSDGTHSDSPQAEAFFEQLTRLHTLVSGHPYLIQLALYWLSERDTNLTSILEEAHKQSGIYIAHLRRQWQIMQRQPMLQEAFAEVLRFPEEGAELDTLMACQLERMGLVQLEGNRALVSSPLYHKHFKALLLPA